MLKLSKNLKGLTSEKPIFEYLGIFLIVLKYPSGQKLLPNAGINFFNIALRL